MSLYNEEHNNLESSGHHDHECGCEDRAKHCFKMCIGDYVGIVLQGTATPYVGFVRHHCKLSDGNWQIVLEIDYDRCHHHHDYQKRIFPNGTFVRIKQSQIASVGYLPFY